MMLALPRRYKFNSPCLGSSEHSTFMILSADDVGMVGDRVSVRLITSLEYHNLCSPEILT